MTDEKGAVKYTYAYNPYGELTKGSYGQVMFLFNGQYGVTSDDNGLYYMRARYYNVSIKRFINQDVVTGSIAESQSLNRYAYVEGNPVSYLDPFGLEKVNRDKLHGVLAGIGTVAFFVGLFFGGSEIVSAVVYAVSAVSGGLNGGLYLDEAIDAETDEVRYESIGNFGLNILGIGTGANANATIHSEFDVCFDGNAGVVKSTGTVLDLIKWIKKIMEVIGKEIKKSIGRD